MVEFGWVRVVVRGMGRRKSGARRVVGRAGELIRVVWVC
jgi:hypothetical protein